MERLFNKLIKNGWFTDSEVKGFLMNPDLLRAINESTSPVFDNIFNALDLVPCDSVKVLILGQDPYPNPLHAHGLAFSSKNTTTPGSLRNIFKALDSVYGRNLVAKKYNDLTEWAKEGVLLLNTALTYKNTFNNSLTPNENKRNQNREKAFHMTTWAPFIDAVITKLINRNKRLVMLLWGGEAWNIVYRNISKLNLKTEEYETGKVKVPDKQLLILHTDHPSQVKINLGGKFLEHAPIHFRECDEFLGKDRINWTVLQDL